MRRLRTVALVAALTVTAVGTAACGSGDAEPDADDAGSPAPPAPTAPIDGPHAAEYLPGLPATVVLPEGDPPAVVVLVPGGSWQTADPTGFLPLGEDLARAGYATVTITYRTDSTGDHFPRPLADVTCAAAFAAQEVPGVPVVVVGHSAGANLTVLAGLRPHEADDECPHPLVAVDGIVGLAGPYDVVGSRIGLNLFGVNQAEDPDLWADGDPFTWVDERPELPVLLVHGEADHVPIAWTDRLADALTDAGHDVWVERVPGATHNDVIRTDVLLAPLTDWLASVVVAP